jgi:hypothetical protein
VIRNAFQSDPSQKKRRSDHYRLPGKLSPHFPDVGAHQPKKEGADSCLYGVNPVLRSIAKSMADTFGREPVTYNKQIASVHCR